MTEHDDDTLRRYLHSQLPDPEARALEVALAQDGTLQRRLAALETLAGPERDAQPGSAPIPTQMQKPLREQKWAIVMAACVAGMMIGYGLSGFVPKAQDWRSDVVEHHALYGSWTIIAHSPTPGELEADLAFASNAAGAKLSVAALSSSRVLTLKKVQVLGVRQSRLAQILYAGTGGVPVGLYAMKRQSPSQWSLSELAIESGTRAGFASATWSTGTTDFLLIGQESQAVITALADDLSYRMFREGQP